MDGEPCVTGGLIPYFTLFQVATGESPGDCTKGKQRVGEKIKACVPTNRRIDTLHKHVNFKKILKGAEIPEEKTVGAKLRNLTD